MRPLPTVSIGLQRRPMPKQQPRRDILGLHPGAKRNPSDKPEIAPPAPAVSPAASEP
jgi:hypothetical protein